MGTDRGARSPRHDTSASGVRAVRSLRGSTLPRSCATSRPRTSCPVSTASTGYDGMNNFYIYRLEKSPAARLIAWDEDNAFPQPTSITTRLEENVLTRKLLALNAYWNAIFQRDARSAATSAADWLRQEMQRQLDMINDGHARRYAQAAYQREHQAARRRCWRSPTRAITYVRCEVSSGPGAALLPAVNNRLRQFGPTPWSFDRWKSRPPFAVEQGCHHAAAPISTRAAPSSPASRRNTPRSRDRSAASSRGRSCAPARGRGDQPPARSAAAPGAIPLSRPQP